MKEDKDKVIQGLKNLKLSRKHIIVEGKKDIACLKKFDVINVRALSKPLFKVCEEIAEHYDEAVILTDMDKEGKKLYSILKKDLTKLGVKIDDTFRNLLFSHSRIAHIEGLWSYLKEK